ncbi:hypothetical protein DUI87_11120 [Hirundo rustica rustica]|uniref:Uncharacterized protein n=1 Tax=Hirundo rustica rustica TaxID=333673 RepID=A0A3M0KXZ4_HIRRU|nr:hypothetical protein DUI87_11120 [Hirundo rustica rustica]
MQSASGRAPGKYIKMDNGGPTFWYLFSLSVSLLHTFQACHEDSEEFHHGSSKDMYHHIIHTCACHDIPPRDRRPSELRVHRYDCGNMKMGEKSRGSTQVLSTLLTILLDRDSVLPVTLPPGPNFLSLQPYSSTIAHLVPRKEREAGLPQTSVPWSFTHFHFVH